ncbi:hypothetical protein ERJ75_001347400 [Trypanosoma vivax]|nr:hypothetical protein ERJ75_001347400 [Trypanosoma vivax]
MQLAPHVRMSATSLQCSTTEYRRAVQKRFNEAPRSEPGSSEFVACLAEGRFILYQLQEAIRLRKYRAISKRYSWASFKDKGELIQLFGEAQAQEHALRLANRDVYGYDVDYTLDNANCEATRVLDEVGDQGNRSRHR